MTDTDDPIAYSYQWSRGGVDVAEATSSTYRLQDADEGYEVACTVSAIGAAETATASSLPTAPVAAVSLNPSGVAMPTAAPAGWAITFADDFEGTSLDTEAWNMWEGQPGGDPAAYWLPSHTSVAGSLLTLSTYEDNTPDGIRWTSGGVGMAASQIYGKYEVRMRGDLGQGISMICLLWPEGGGWPPEIDFYEDAPATNTTRDATAATLHWDAANHRYQETLSGYDFTDWHTVGLEWTAAGLSYTIDGTVWGTVSAASLAAAGAADQAEAFPSVAMSLDIQTQALTAPAPNAATPATVNMEIDWVVVYVAAT
jgi:beta-glucanase (GH16 family)